MSDTTLRKRPKTRPDELVLPKDIELALPLKLYEALFKSKANADRMPTLISDAIQLLKAHLDRPNSQRLVPCTNEHQLITDMLVALSVLPVAVPDSERCRLISELIMHSDTSNRGTYQFVRAWLREQLAVMLQERGISLDVAPVLFPPEIRDRYKRDGLATGPSGLPARGIAFASGAIAGGLSGDLWELIKAGGELVWTCFKGEFTHFYEVFPALEAIAEKDSNAGIAIAVGEPELFEEVNEHITKRAPSIHCRCQATKGFRYYILPDEYIILLGGSGQFITFRGRTQTTECTSLLVLRDFGDRPASAAVDQGS